MIMLMYLLICRFSMLHNSNLDKDPTVRKSNKELIEDLQKWEKAHNVKTVEVKDLDKYEVKLSIHVLCQVLISF